MMRILLRIIKLTSFCFTILMSKIGALYVQAIYMHVMAFSYIFLTIILKLNFKEI